MILQIGQGTTIPLATSQGNSIDNVQHPCTPDLADQHWDSVFAKRHLSAKPRAKMSGRYNCHGMVFASRRTRIFSANEVQKIITEDSYIDVTLENVLEGDFILYQEEGDIIHSGIVIEPPSATNMYNPLVISKWGSGREYIHRGNDCPYPFMVRYIRI
ncbi:MAG: hypothetical protein V4493_11200 [Pseudomonadota bacterium]